MASLGAMLPMTGLGAAAALWNTQEKAAVTFVNCHIGNSWCWSTCCNGTATTIGGSACISNEDKYILHLPSFASSQSKFNCYFSKVSFKYPPRAEERGGGRKRGEEGYTSAPLAVKSEVSSCEIKKKVFENLGFWEELQLLVFQGSKGVNRSHAEQGGKLPPPSFNRSRFRHAVSLTVTGSLLQLVTRQSKL